MTPPKMSFATLILLSSVVTVVVTLGVMPLLALTGVGWMWVVLCTRSGYGRRVQRRTVAWRVY